jgi:hypothetical protein
MGEIDAEKWDTHPGTDAGAAGVVFFYNRRAAALRAFLRSREERLRVVTEVFTIMPPSVCGLGWNIMQRLFVVRGLVH